MATEIEPDRPNEPPEREEAHGGGGGGNGGGSFPVDPGGVPPGPVPPQGQSGGAGGRSFPEIEPNRPNEPPEREEALTGGGNAGPPPAGFDLPTGQSYADILAAFDDGRPDDFFSWWIPDSTPIGSGWDDELQPGGLSDWLLH